MTRIDPPSDRPDIVPALVVVHDEPLVADALRRAFGAAQVIDVGDVDAAAGILERAPIAVIVIGPRARHGALVALGTRFPRVQRVLLVEAPELPNEDESAAVFRVLARPFDEARLARVVARALEQHRLLGDHERLWAENERQTAELRSLNRDLEDRIRRRTGQLARAKLEWEGTFDAIVDPLAIIDAEFRVVRANVAFGRGAGVDVRQVPGQRCYAILAGRDQPCVGCPLASALSGHRQRSVDIVATKGRVLEVSAYPLDDAARSDTDRPSSVEGEPVVPRAVCYYRDVTDARSLSAELERTRRLASLGLFVGGVAHEINNPLGTILAYTQILLRRPGQEPELTETLEEIQTSALRTKRIIASLMAFAQGSELRHAELSLGEILEEAVAAFRRDYGGRLEIETRIGDHLPRIQGDPTLIHQLLRNLLQNAEHATEERGGKVVATVERGSGGAVVLEVSDDGVGISEAQLGRVFDPFFTTKLGGRGTGLGLSICHRIVEQHKGSIEVRSTVGVGTTFRVSFPAIARAPS